MRYLPIGFLFVLVGCSNASKAEMLPIEKVPENVMTVAKDKLPGVTFDQAVKLGDGTYEVIGKDSKGKVREIEISPSGEVLQIE